MVDMNMAGMKDMDVVDMDMLDIDMGIPIHDTRGQ